jgi:hypothetical protein
MTKNILITVAVALVVSLGVVAFTTKNGSVGSISEKITWTENFAVGKNIGGSAITLLKTGTVNCSGALIGGTVNATSTGVMDCAVSGVKSGDYVLLGRPAGMTSTWAYVGAYASTTASGYFSAVIYNNTGANAIPPSTATTSVPYVIFR